MSSGSIVGWGGRVRVCIRQPCCRALHPSMCVPSSWAPFYGLLRGSCGRMIRRRWWLSHHPRVGSWEMWLSLSYLPQSLIMRCVVERTCVCLIHPIYSPPLSSPLVLFSLPLLLLADALVELVQLLGDQPLLGCASPYTEWGLGALSGTHSRSSALVVPVCTTCCNRISI